MEPDSNQPHQPVSPQPQQNAAPAQQHQYGAPPYPPQYYPPPKKGLPGWAWALIGCGGLFAVLFIVGILALAAIPLITSNTRDARRAEGELLMESMRNQARVAYSRSRTAPRTLTGDYEQDGSNVDPADLHGTYYSVRDSIGTVSDSEGELVCDPQQVPSDGIGRMRFNWQDSSKSVHWE